MPANPCIHCGACCAYYRASFYWREADDVTPGGVPVGMTEHLQDLYRVMIGTNQKNPRCIALLGDIGSSVGCSIYEQRSTVCRDFMPSLHDGVTVNDRCDKARAIHNLPPLTLADWAEPAAPGDPSDPEHPDNPTRPLRPAA